MAGASITISIYHSVNNVGHKVLTNVGVIRILGKTTSGKIDCTKTRIPKYINNAIHDLIMVDLACGTNSSLIWQKALVDLYKNIAPRIKEIKNTI